MKNKIIILVLIVAVIIAGFMFLSTLIDYFKIYNEIDNELNRTNNENNNNSDVSKIEADSNSNVIKVDDDSSIIVVKEYDESMFKGKKSIVFFWASWCSHCQEEYDVVKEVVNNYQNRGYNIYVVSHDYEIAELSDFMKSNDFNYEVYFDEQRIIRAHFDPEASSVPLTYIIDENARLIYSHGGAITLDELDNAIDEYIN